MDERMRFVIRLKDGESMASLCREFGISRKTGYKIFERYEECGLEGLSDRTRRPFRYANPLPEQIEAAIVAAKREKPNNQTGCKEDSRALAAAIAARGQSTSLQHDSCHPGSSWLGDSSCAIENAHDRYASFGRTATEQAVVHRLQGRIHARRQAIAIR